MCAAELRDRQRRVHRQYMNALKNGVQDDSKFQRQLQRDATAINSKAAEKVRMAKHAYDLVRAAGIVPAPVSPRHFDTSV